MIKIVGVDKDLLIIVVGKALQVIIAFLALRLLTQLLDVSQVGYYYTLLTMLTLCNFFFLNGIGQYYNRFLYHCNETGSLQPATNLLLLSRFLLIILASLFLIPVYFLSELSEYFDFYVFSLVIFFSLASGSTLVLVNSLNILKNRVAFVCYTVAAAGIGVISASIIAVHTKLGAVGWLIGLSLGQVAVFYPAYRKLVCFSNVKFSLVEFWDNMNLRKVMVFSIPISFVLLFQWVNNSSYRLLMGEFYSINTVAQISIAFAVSASIFNAFEGLLTQYYLPDYYSKIVGANSAQRLKYSNSIISQLMSYYLVLLAFIVFFSDYILILLVDAKFHGVGTFLQLAAGFEFFRASSNVVYLVSQSEVNTKGALLPYALGGSVLVIALTQLDMSEYIFGVPLVMFLSSFVVFLTLFFNMRKLLPIDFPWKKLGKVATLIIPLASVLLFIDNLQFYWVVICTSFGALYLLFTLYLVYRSGYEA